MRESQDLHSWTPDYACPPGWTLKETLESLGMSQKDLATRTGLTEKTISRIVNGVDPISPETANRLEIVTGVASTIWNNLDRRYREHKAKEELRDRLKGYYPWVRDRKFPTAELRKRGYLPVSREHGAVVEGLLKFFGVSSPEAWEAQYESVEIAFRRSKKVRAKPALIWSWIRVAQIEAASIACQPFDADRFKESLIEARELSADMPRDFCARLIRSAALAGVAVAFVPPFSGAGINGAASWLSSSKAIIALCNRGRYADMLWFDYFHEAAHILKHRKRTVFVDFDTSSSGSKPKEEQEADEFSSSLLVPRNYDNQLKSLKTADQIREFAKRIGVHPGTVVGRLQHDRLIPFNRFQSLRQKLQWKPTREHARIGED